MSNRRWPDWVDEATSPADSEVQRLDSFGSDALRDAIIDVTSPSDEELGRLLRRRPWSAPARSRTPWIVGGLGVLAAAAAVALVVSPSDSIDAPVGYGTLEVALDRPLELNATVRHLGPSIDMTGDGRVVLDQASEAGTEVTLLEGRVHFDVDPAGAWRDLAIDADGVMVRVHGTIFDVIRDGDTVAVEVERGRVSVTWDGEESFVTAGQSWTRPDSSVAMVPVSEPEGVELDVIEPAPVVVRNAPVERTERTAQGTAEAEPEPEVVLPDEPVSRIRQGSPDHELAQILALKSTGLAPAELLVETDGVLSRHRGSGVSAEIELVRLQTLAEVDPAAAAVEMAEWLDEHPSASRAPLVRFELAQVRHRALGRCASALGEYRALADRTDDIGTRATAGAGLCALELGSDQAALRYLDTALARGLSGTLLVEVRSARASLSP